MLIRSAFWLTVGFIMVAPHGTDLGATVNALKDQAVQAGVSAGQQIVVGQLLDTIPAPVLPMGGQSTSPSPEPALKVRSGSTAPFPRPRPRWMG